MPETTGKTAGDEDDELRKRFAHLTDMAEEAEVEAQDDLPPVPDIKVTRPGTQAARETAPGQLQGRKSGNGIGLMGSAGDVKGSAQALTIGTQLVGSIIGGVLLGWLADKYLLHSKETPWGLIVGFLLGVTSGFVNLVRVANRLNKD